MEFSREILNQIAESLEMGEKCFIHKQTFKIVTYPDYILDYEPDNSAWQEEIKKVESDENYKEVERMDSHDSFKIMEEFAEALNDRTMKIILLKALDGKKPFANFKYQIENSVGYRESWFAFRRERQIGWVEEQLDAVFH